MSTAYSTEKRSRAAKWGWKTRKEGLPPQVTAALRFRAAMRAADPRLARLYTCAVAESVQCHYLATFPGDSRTIEAIALARRYATGKATDKERLTAMQSLQRLYSTIADGYSDETPALCALGAAIFVLNKRLVWAVEWGLYWADLAANPAGNGRLDYERHSPALEALAR